MMTGFPPPGADVPSTSFASRYAASGRSPGASRTIRASAMSGTTAFAASDNPLLAALSHASDRMDDLHRRATDWVASARQRAADGETTSSTLEQIEIKQFLSAYENALTLSNAVIAKLRELMSRITNNL